MILPTAQAWNNTRVVEECLRGNERAWHMLVDRYKNLIYSIPFKHGVPPEDAADIFQSVCLDLFNELSRLRDAEALGGWLIRVTHHKCYHWKRRRDALAEESASFDTPEHHAVVTRMLERSAESSKPS